MNRVDFEVLCKKRSYAQSHKLEKLGVRMRNFALVMLLFCRRFKDEQIDILVATDVAARGLDIDGVKTVSVMAGLPW